VGRCIFTILKRSPYFHTSTPLAWKSAVHCFFFSSVLSSIHRCHRMLVVRYSNLLLHAIFHFFFFISRLEFETRPNARRWEVAWQWRRRVCWCQMTQIQKYHARVCKVIHVIAPLSLPLFFPSQSFFTALPWRMSDYSFSSFSNFLAPRTLLNTHSSILILTTATFLLRFLYFSFFFSFFLVLRLTSGSSAGKKCVTCAS